MARRLPMVERFPSLDKVLLGLERISGNLTLEEGLGAIGRTESLSWQVITTLIPIHAEPSPEKRRQLVETSEKELTSLCVL